MIRCLVIFCCAIGCAFAQVQVNYIFHVDSGARILYQIYSEIPVSNGEKSVAKAECSGNRIRRLIMNQEGIPWLGFDIHFQQEPGERPFHITVEAIPGVPFFTEAPAPRDVENGGRILFDVLEDPSTGNRIFDTFQVGAGDVLMQIMPMPRTIPQPVPAGAVMQLNGPDFIEHDKLLGKSQLSQAGNRVGVQSNLGRFLFSTEPLPGYRMEAIAEDNSIQFLAGNKSYELRCKSSVLNRPGSWYLWVKATPPGPLTGDVVQLLAR